MMLSQPVLDFVQCESLFKVILTTTSSPPPLNMGLIHNGVFLFCLFGFLLILQLLVIKVYITFMWHVAPHL